MYFQEIQNAIKNEKNTKNKPISFYFQKHFALQVNTDNHMQMST